MLPRSGLVQEGLSELERGRFPDSGFLSKIENIRNDKGFATTFFFNA